MGGMEQERDEGMRKMAELPAEQMPREKLISRGRAALSDEELIALFLRTGLPGCNVLQLAARLKQAAGSLTVLGSMEAREIAACCKGIGTAKAATLAAVFELGQRAVQESMQAEVMDSPEKVYRLLAGELRYERQENILVLLLNVKRQLLGRCHVAKGTLSRVMTHGRDVFREAVRHSAASIILVHNHPSGDPTPSEADRQLTKNIAESGELLGIPLRDHVIIGTEGVQRVQPYYSFKEQGYL